jgi:hypothetical protein
MAIISRKNNLCFIHINNTGGTTICKLLEDIIPDIEILGKKHSTISEALNEMPEINNYYKFSYVRHPYDLLVSVFTNIIMNNSHPDYSTISKLSFYEFIQWLGDIGLKRKNDDSFPVYRKQTDFVFKRNDILVNDIYKYENLCNDTGLSNANTLFLKLGFNMPEIIPVLNKTERNLNWDNLYNIKTYRLVNELFSEDFKNFKYKKNEC